MADDIGPTGTNNLVVHPGYGGGANNTFQIEGNELVNANAQINAGVSLNQGDPGSSMYYNQLAFMDGSGNIQQVLTNQNTDLLLNLNPYGHGSGVLKVSGNEQISGTVRIGSTQAGSTLPNAQFANYQLSVDGQIAAKELIVQISSWSDTVFSKNYQLRSLIEVDKYIDQNHHLPDVPDEDKVIKEGVNVGQMNATLLKKVEELTLYTIHQQKQIDDLQKQLSRLIK